MSWHTLAHPGESGCLVLVAGGPPASDASGAAEADRDRAVLDDDGDSSLPFAELQHLVQVRAVCLDVVVLMLDPSRVAVLTGRGGVGSAGLAVDGDDRRFRRHGLPPLQPDGTAVSVSNVAGSRKSDKTYP